MDSEILLPEMHSSYSAEELLKITQSADDYIEVKEILDQYFDEDSEDAATLVMMLRFFDNND